jgi:RNA polymerase sigma-70 factor (ECF subfamily)
VAGRPRIGAPPAHALVALMAFQAARLPARIDSHGEMVLLEDQDRRLWDRDLVSLGFAHLERSAEGHQMTSYHVQAAIAALHAGTETPHDTKWTEILALYDDLIALNPSPVVALNRAVAVSRVVGPAAALEAIKPLEADPTLARYYLLPAVKGRLLAELGDRVAAAGSYRTALDCRCSEPERRFLQRQLAKLGGLGPEAGGRGPRPEPPES